MVVPPPLAEVLWQAYRIVATRYPAVDLWGGLPPNLWSRLDLLEAQTNPRLQAPVEPSSAYIQWPFSNPRPGRFSTATLGAFYAARMETTAIAETAHYQAIRCQEDDLDPHEFDMRVLSVHVQGPFHDVRGDRALPFPGILDPDSHRASRALAEDLVAQGSQGVVFPSVRDPLEGPCIAAFTPKVITTCGHLRYLSYRWTGSRVEVLYEKRPYPA